MSKILEKYHLTFKNIVLPSGANLKYCSVPDATDFAIIASHLSEDTYFTESYELALENVENAIANLLYDEDNIVGETPIHVTPSVVNIAYRYAIPIADYRDILIEWVKFLKLPPLNNQKVR